MTAPRAAAPAAAPAPPAASAYASRPWVRLLSPAQRAPLDAPPTLLHAFRTAAGRAPGRTALAYFDGRIDYAAADALSDSLAGHFAARGIGRGDRVAVALQNTPHFVLAVLAAWKAGAVVVPVNPMYREAEARHVLRDSGAAALVCGDRAWAAELCAAAAGTASARRPRRSRVNRPIASSPFLPVRPFSPVRRPAGSRRRLLHQIRHPPHVRLPVRVLQVEDRVQVPVEVVGEVRGLLLEHVRRVRHDSPRRLPASSTSNAPSQCGQETAARVWPSALIRR
ncbi:AMP-binding protein [Streptomyces sp. WAC05292]|uniref:AMP-binding protein n=1 Tax=Streptomyces sp. WAC05292 TaxID=2487418 RepID=UPI00267911ED